MIHPIFLCLTMSETKTALRDFPKTFLIKERLEMFDLCLQALRNCINLESCTWTRDGALSTEMLQILSQAQRLTELELNGRNEWRYDQTVLCHFKHLTKITLIMPSGPVAGILPQWTAATARTLKNLTLICRVSRGMPCYDGWTKLHSPQQLLQISY